MITAERYHDISCGHRVWGHENKCGHFHGHNYRFHFKVTANKLDKVGRVVDFSVIKERLCQWLENEWDHKMLLWKEDPEALKIASLDPSGVVLLDFNPTAENLAYHMVLVVGIRQLKNTGCTLIECKVEETTKCSATFRYNDIQLLKD